MAPSLLSLRRQVTFHETPRTIPHTHVRTLNMHRDPVGSILKDQLIDGFVLIQDEVNNSIRRIAAEVR